MRKQLIIAVTQQDIDSGERWLACECPIAKSLRRRYPGKSISVDYEHIHIGRRAIPITRKMEYWMSDFDAGQPVQPTAFFVDGAA